MPSDYISFKDSGYFSSLIMDYLDQKSQLKSFYNRFPSIEQFSDQIAEKKQSYDPDTRAILVSALEKQYEGIDASSATKSNIQALKKDITFTITTGHQLNLFTGPLYFLYKIVSAINLSKRLKATYPTQNFVPIYWMATEDHDFEEINFFNFKGKKLQWNRTAEGAVGRMDLEGLDKILEVFSLEIGLGTNADTLKSLFEEAYLTHATLTEATRFLANALFGDSGLVILDGDDRSLKQLFAPYVESELLHQTSYNSILPTANALADLGYTVQVNSREINLFYLTNGLRERIIKRESSYYVNETDIVWSETDILQELKEFPERFSPNVMMRPLYQEVILPNLCYIGGGGELAYWLELKQYFDAVKTSFPILLLRNSILLKNQKLAKKQNKLEVSDKDLFLKSHELINRKVRQVSNINIDLTPQRNHLKDQFSNLYELAAQTDVSFINAVKAQEVKQLKGLDVLETRLLKAQRLKLKDHVERVTKLQNELFPNQSLQERTKNFSEFYLEYGQNLIDTLLKTLDPLRLEFVILTMP
ncbi:bacillithiol biosynthesis cysteine-adding enzyme BshC [Aquimarina sp. W85]|uniref:bacillithiol biosynthesis cysteine-adding enzyme BshC n=1 Tax=Aquimarina rhodophyticola TaxID=3342246 RepID=UPI00366D14FB